MLIFLLMLPLMILLLVLEGVELVSLLSTPTGIPEPMGLALGFVAGILVFSLAAVGWAFFDDWRLRHKAAPTLS